jgi:hypothetical protein
MNFSFYVAKKMWIIELFSPNLEIFKNFHKKMLTVYRFTAILVFRLY